MAAWWDNLSRVWTNTEWSWIVLWLGLTLLMIALVLLVRTRWGQSQPLGKCAVLSLLAHLLLAVYATTVQIVTASSGRGHSDSIRAALVDGDEWSARFIADKQATPEARNVSEAVASSPNEAEPARLGLIGTNSNGVNQKRSDPPATEPLQAAALASNLPSMAATPLETTTNPIRQPAETIDEPNPEAVIPPVEAMPEVVSPDRLSAADTAAIAAINDQGVDRSAKRNPESGLTDPISRLLNDTQFNAGDDSPFVRTRRPVNFAANSSAAEIGNAASSGQSGYDAGSLLVPVKSVNSNTDAAPPPIYRDRLADDHEAVARSRGGSAETEAAVQAALAWLAIHQSPDGRWDADRHGAGDERKVLGHDRQGAGAKADTAATGLALLAFLGAGQTHLNGKYKDNVKRGLEHLLNAQATDGNLSGDAELFAFMYSHGIATLALSEAYAMTGDKRLENGLRAAIGFTVTAQHPTTGGWRYRIWSSSPNDAGDTSQLGWQLMALKSAELSGIAIPKSTRDGMARFLGSVSSGTQGGLASYRPRERATRPMTAEALVCRQFLGMTRDNPAANEAGDYLLGELPSSDPINLYYWYYGTLGMYQLQGDHWRQWNSALQKTLVKRQVAAGDAAGSWDPDCVWAGYGGRVYSTAMATLCLEVYYRYLPLYGDFGPELREAKREPAR